MSADDLVCLLDRLASIGRSVSLEDLGQQLAQAIAAGDLPETARLFDLIDAETSEDQHSDEPTPTAERIA